MMDNFHFSDAEADAGDTTPANALLPENKFHSGTVPHSLEISNIARKGEEIGAPPRADGVVGLTDVLPDLAGGAPVAAAGSFPDRVCEFCNTPLHRKKTEQRTHWEVRRFCNQDCSKSFYKQTKRRRAEVIVVEGEFPVPVDRGCEGRLYGSESYDAPGRIVRPSFAPRMSPVFGTHVETQSAMASC